jgi:DNA invertase Pin-like site-specific DNA recombinase
MKGNDMRVALYARVSTKAQNPETQLLPLREYAKNRGFTDVTEYVDHGFSGSKDHRPALDKLMHDARARKIDAVLVWKFDRFARSVKHLVLALHEFNCIGIQFLSFTEQLDTSSALGQALFSIISAVGQLERDLIRERVKAGLDRARANGIKLGRRPKDVDVDRVLSMYDQLKSLRLVSKALGMSRALVHRTLRRHAPKPIPVAV